MRFQHGLFRHRDSLLHSRTGQVRIVNPAVWLQRTARVRSDAPALYRGTHCTPSALARPAEDFAQGRFLDHRNP